MTDCPQARPFRYVYNYNYMFLNNYFLSSKYRDHG